MEKHEKCAFPVVRGREEQIEAAGLTTRELFAAMAMQGLCTNPVLGSKPDHVIAALAVAQADALVQALKEKDDSRAEQKV